MCHITQVSHMFYCAQTHTPAHVQDAAKLCQGQVELAKSIALIECQRREINIEITASIYSGPRISTGG